MQEWAYGDEDRDDADVNNKTLRVSVRCSVLFHKPIELIELVQGGLLHLFLFCCFVFDKC